MSAVGSPQDGKADVTTAPTADEVLRIAADNPISLPAEDRLGRMDAVKSFVRQILEMDASQGLTAGVFGPWGSGKTSFIRLVRAELKKKEISVVDFNPWMFSDTEQLVTRFFSEVSANLGRVPRLKKVADAIGGYGGAVVGATNLVSLAFAGIPQLGSVLTPLFELLKASTGDKGLDELREAVAAALGEQKRPVVVVLDDVDRLSFQEIRDVFKLVRLTASFPNLVYVVLCDRKRVEEALAERREDDAYGQRYLDKIIQLPFDLPKVPRHLLDTQLDDALERAVPGLEELLKAEQDWLQILLGVVKPLIANMRDVTRYAAAVHWAWRDLQGQVAIGDLLAMEAIRLFVPAAFGLLHEAADALTFPANARSTERDVARLTRGEIGPPDPWARGMVERILEADEKRRGVVTAMVEHLFPYGNRVAQANDDETWNDDFGGEMQGEGRVADESVLRLYLERVAGPDLLIHSDAKQALRLMSVGTEEAEAFLCGMDADRRIEVIREVRNLEGDIGVDEVEAGVVVLLNQLPKVPDRPKFWGAGYHQVIRASVHFLLSALDSPGEVVGLVDKVLPDVETLSSKTELLGLICNSEDQGEHLVSEEASVRFNERLADEIRERFTENEIIEEGYGLASVISFPARVGLQPIPIPDSIELDFRIIHSAKKAHSVGSGDSHYLRMNLLDHLYGNTGNALTRMERLRQAFNLEEWRARLDAWGISQEDATATIDLVHRQLSTYQDAAKNRGGPDPGETR